MKTEFQYDHYYAYHELEEHLKHFASKYPDLCSLESNMKTAESRCQYVMTLTNFRTGDAFSKPALYIDGNIHAGEVTSSMTAMCTIDVLLSNYGTDPSITKLLDSTVFYIIPRVTPDGAETYLSTPYHIRSVNKTYLSEKGGIRPEDLDHDSVIRMMAIPTQYGAWKKDPVDPSSMTPRLPDDTDGEFYDIYPEGVMEQYAGDENLKQKKADWGLDFNRNFPVGWYPESRQPGAGPYPLSNPECKSIVDFVLSHPNICSAAIGHTSGGLILYPPGTRSSKTISPSDLKAFRDIAEMGEKELGYKAMNIFDSFMSDQENYDSGALDDWFYQTQGIPSYTMEFWDICSKAGVPYEWGAKMKEETAEQKMKRFNAVVKWIKKNAPQYFMDWTKFHHPYFGDVEIGGINTKFTIQNPPESMLADTCMNDAAFNLRFAKALPHLSIDSIAAEKISDGIYKITALVGNRGYLPVYLSEESKKLKTAETVSVRLEGAEEIDGLQKKDAGFLSGYSRTDTGEFYGNLTTFTDAKMKKKTVWIIHAKPGDSITIHASHNKAGICSKTIVIS